MSEQWRAVPGFEGLYEVSDLGRVRSLDRAETVGNRWGSKTRRFVPGRVLALKRAGRGYRAVALSVRGEVTYANVHRLVLRAFVGERGDGQETRHLNGVRHDNRLLNLVYGTGAENQADRERHGTGQRGERNASHKLTTEDVLAIRSARASQATIARQFGISQGQVWRILQRQQWSHV